VSEGRSTPPQPPAPRYTPEVNAERRSSGHGQGWLIVVGLVFAFAVGGLAAAIISKGDDSNTPVPSTVVQQNTTTVTTPAPDITVAPDITLAPDGTPAPIPGGGEGSESTDTSQGGTTTTDP
jgi:hypothetical protein